jgi:hypothetical protein
MILNIISLICAQIFINTKLEIKNMRNKTCIIRTFISYNIIHKNIILNHKNHVFEDIIIVHMFQFKTFLDITDLNKNIYFICNDDI